MRSPSHWFNPGAASDRGVSGAPQGLATAPVSKVDRDPVVDDRAAARRVDDLRFRRRVPFRHRLQHGAGALVVSLRDLEHAFRQREIGDRVERHGEMLDLLHDGETGAARPDRPAVLRRRTDTRAAGFVRKTASSSA